MPTPTFPLLRKFLNYGIHPNMLEPEKRRIWLLNVFFLMGAFAFVASTVETFIVDGRTEGLLILGFTIAFLGGAAFIVSEKTRFAEFYLLFVANICLFVFENRHGPEAGTFLFYFPFMVFMAFLVDFRRFWFAFTNIFLTVGLIIAGIVLRYKFLYHTFPQKNDYASFLFNLVFCGVMTAAVSLVIILQSYRQYGDFLARMEERRLAEESMKAAIREKETLLAEVHHRVKNNLAVISSLLNLQMNTVTNEYTRDVLRESRNRVASMALIHQKLYDTPNVEEIDFGQYASSLVEEIRYSYSESVTENVNVKVTTQHHPLSLTVAIPCALILNELLTNCYKHAFPAGRAGSIWIRFEKNDAGEGFYMQVEDDGAGLPKNFRPDQTHSLGMTIIQSLAEQIDACWKIAPREPQGTRFRMEFKASVR